MWLDQDFRQTLEPSSLCLLASPLQGGFCIVAALLQPHFKYLWERWKATHSVKYWRVSGGLGTLPGRAPPPLLGECFIELFLRLTPLHPLLPPRSLLMLPHHFRASEGTRVSVLRPTQSASSSRTGRAERFRSRLGTRDVPSV